MQNISLWIEVFSGLGLFLFGMLYLETQIKAAAGHSFRRIIRSATASRFKSLMTGLAATAFFQSSSVVTLMALSLIGAELLSLEGSIAIIFGSNIGTTVTSWVVALVGFKMDIKLLAYVLIGVGGLGGVMASDEGRWKNYFGVMVGFGLLFLGLEGMKQSFGSFSDSFDLNQYIGINPYWFALIGLVITVIIQSSSASIAIIQSAVFTHMVSFETAAAFVIGANVGTTVTVILGALGGIPDKKRTALVHLLFNVSTGIVALLLLNWLIDIVDLTAPQADGVVKIALFHTLFNLLGVVLWYPFISSLTQQLQYFFKKEPQRVTHYLHSVSIDIPDLALEALRKELDHLSENIESFALLAINLPAPKVLEQHQAVDKLLEKYNENFDISYEKVYKKILLLEGEIYRYISLLSAKSSTQSEQDQLIVIQRQVAYLATAVKSIKDMLYDLNRLYDAPSNEEQAFYKNLRYQILQSVLAFHNARHREEIMISDMELVYKKIAESYKNSMKVVEDIVKNQTIGSEITSMAINSMHLAKSFSKSLRNALSITTSSVQ